MGAVFLPSRVRGFSAISRRQMMTFIEGRQFRENSSQREGSFGPACRLTLTMTLFVSAITPQRTIARASRGRAPSFHGVVPPRPRLDRRNVHWFIRKLNFVIHPFGARGLEPVGIVAVRKLRLVM